MANDYHDILIEHIEALMRERNISQADIIRGTGIPQPQMSKALNRTKGNRFTFEQTIAIADFFDVSIDYLVGRKLDQPSSEKLSNKEICKILMQLIESGVIDYIDQTIEEDKYLAVNYPTNGYPYEYKKENSTYRMFYFSEFINPDITGLCEEQLDELNWDFSTGGNDNKKSAEINAFLNYFFKLYDVYKRNDLPREIFDQAISDRLDKLVK